MLAVWTLTWRNLSSSAVTPFTRCRQLGFQVEDDSQDQRAERGSAEQISQVDDAADCAGCLDLTCMKCDKRVSVAEHLHNIMIILNSLQYIHMP